MSAENSTPAEEILPIDLSPDPVVEAYKKDVDRTLLRENLKRTVEERIAQLAGMAEFMEEARKALDKTRS